MNRNPQPLTDAEWSEVISVGAVREAWGLEDDADPADFASTVYGVKFNFVSGAPGYVGDLYVLQGDAITELHPMVLRRDRSGHLVVS
jgi:hypothetical protein